MMEDVPSYVITIGMAPGDQFFFYKKGVFTGSTSYNHNSMHSLHAVTIVGYGVTDDAQSSATACSDSGTDYWILRNSWATSWGA